MTVFVVAVFVVALLGLAGCAVYIGYQLVAIALEATADVVRWLLDRRPIPEPAPPRRAPISHVRLVYDQEVDG